MVCSRCYHTFLLCSCCRKAAVGTAMERSRLRGWLMSMRLLRAQQWACLICQWGYTSYQSIKHLVQDCSKAPPVHSPVVGLLVKNFRSKILWKRRKRSTLVKGICLVSTVPPISDWKQLTESQQYLSYQEDASTFKNSSGLDSHSPLINKLSQVLAVWYHKTHPNPHVFHPQEKHMGMMSCDCRLRTGRTSGVPQKVEVVPLCSMFSLQSPKSVKTMCPCESSRIFSGFKSL